MDLRNDFASQAKVIPDKGVLRSEAVRIAKSMLAPPKREDFVEVTESLIDPNNPSGGTFHQIVTDKDGKPKLKREAYEQALKVYEHMKKLRQSGDPDPVKTIADRIENAQKEQLKTLSKNNSMDAAVGTGSSEFKNSQACGDLPEGPRKDYCIARTYVVTYFNGEAPGQKKESSGKKQIANSTDRNPAAKKDTWDSKNLKEDYELKAGKAAKEGKNETENLYMESSYIDDVIQSQYPK